MKKAIFCLVLAIIFGLAACDNGTTTDEVIETYEVTLTDCITLTAINSVAQQWIPQTSFLENEYFAFAIKGLNPNGNVITKVVFTLKENGQIAYEPEEIQVFINTEEFTHFIGSWWTYARSGMTVEVYVVDSNGNESNTISSPPYEIK